MRSRTYTLRDNTKLQAIQDGDPECSSVILILHGLAVSKEVQRPELSRLAAEGFFAIATDAPHHGSRDDGWIDVLRGKDRREQQQMMLSVIFQEAQEIGELSDMFKKEGKKVCVSGISMGAYAVYAMLLQENKPDLFAPFLGNPDFRAGQYSILPPSLAEKCGPADHLDQIYPSSLFMFNGGSDTIVDSTGAKKFYEALKPFYADAPEKLEFYEYPESDHMMRPEDWFDGWGKFIKRLKREGF